MKWNRLFVGVLALIPAVAGVGVSAQDGGGRAWGIYVDGDREEMAGGEEDDGVVEDKVLEEVVVTGQGARQRFESLQLGAEKLELSKLALTAGGNNGPRMFEGDFCLGYFLAAPVAEGETVFHPDDLSVFE